MKTGGYLKSHSSLRRFREIKGEVDDVWQVDEADRKFSIEVRKRDGQCVNCGSTSFLGCSHFFPRGVYATRFDPENGDTLCQECHEIWEYEKNGIYRDFKVMQLGEEKFKELKERSTIVVSPYTAIVEFMKLCENLSDNDIQY